MSGPPAPAGYRLLGRLSPSDGPTEVWAAETLAGTGVVVKLLRPEARQREDLRLRFSQEADLLVRLGGRHGLVRALAALSEPPTIVLEPLDPRSLGARLHPAGEPVAPVPLPEALRIGIGLADAIGWLHRHDVIHRDVKPANVLFAAGREVRLIDLGVAASGNPPRGLPSGWVEERVGTLGRAAPELVADAGTATPAVDVYGLGVTVYEALSGHLPYDFGPGETEEHYARRIVGGEDPVPLAARVPSLPGAVSELVGAAIAPRPGLRPTLAELDRGLRQILDGRY